MRSPDDLLRLGSLGARLIQALLIATESAFALPPILAGRGSLFQAVALALFIVAILLLGHPFPGEMPLRWSLTAVGLCVAITLLTEVTLPNHGWPGYDSWNFGATTWLLFFVSLRGRPRLAWVGFALVALVTLGWVLAVGRPPLDAVLLVVRHAGTLLMGTLFQLILTRSLTAISAMQRARVAHAAEAAAAEARMRDGERWARQLGNQVTPVLSVIAEAGPISETDRKEFILVEVALRDILRGGELATPTIVSLARAARERGARVDLVDDSGGNLSEDQIRQVVRELEDHLRGLRTGQLTARLLPPGRDEIATIVRDGDEGYARREFVTTG